ncbi:selenocysteine-specific translation elongation factor [Xylocopilactobacillus apicola]|uniref:Selenocysteine-specific elongation factor n=1 Tax=Xylocopilactobacillus apicola TaxID=2932184 RepID=A0AAU9D5P8_9LACO|nr:selenocysteine-specific translation elongation factor [Xylocopilactobacillus apicola]BDR57605.1 selenocysteine-specific translation elongation factor [Xylocopilactobacillus apicola]
MDQIVIATAGHVDHGKTTLIKSLTGVDTDTTEEEKSRGLTINLGFTFLKLPNDQRVGIVDVPGHEKFLKNMLAGLSGVDLVLLVIDVNESVMPQTIEHASILRLIGLTNFIIVLTKVKTTDQEMIEFTISDIKETFKSDPVLINAPIIKTDAASGFGLNDLIAEIQKMSQKIKPRKNTGFARLNIDRNFVIKGFGTVVTGTLLEGAVKNGDNLILYPEEKNVHVKSVRTYDQATDTALPGQRTALNVNLAADEISRGSVIATKNTVQITDEINVNLKTLNFKEQLLELNTRVHVYVGATEVLGRIYPLGTDDFKPESECFAQIRLEQPIVVKYGDHFIIRSYSPLITLGGGQILDPKPPTRKRFDQQILQQLKIRHRGKLKEMIVDYASYQKEYLLNPKDLAVTFNESPNIISREIENLITDQEIVKIDNQLLVIKNAKLKNQQIINELEKYHQQYPLRSGCPRSVVQAQLSAEIGESAAKVILKYLETKDLIRINGENYHLASFSPQLTKEDQAIQLEIHQRLVASGNTPPSIDELVNGQARAKEVLMSMIGDDVVLLDSETVIDREVYQKIAEQVRSFIKENGPMSLADYRDLTGSSRRYAMLVLTKMDQDGITERSSNKRILKKGHETT